MCASKLGYYLKMAPILKSAVTLGCCNKGVPWFGVLEHTHRTHKPHLTSIHIQMFYSDSMLTKKGPLANIWLAAHWDKKLSKTQIVQTDINDSVRTKSSSFL